MIPDTNHAVFMPEKHGLEVTIWVGLGGIKAILAIKVVKLAGL
jgi:phosphotransferase system IIA component